MREIKRHQSLDWYIENKRYPLVIENFLRGTRAISRAVLLLHQDGNKIESSSRGRIDALSHLSQLTNAYNEFILGFIDNVDIYDFDRHFIGTFVINTTRIDDFYANIQASMYHLSNLDIESALHLVLMAHIKFNNKVDYDDISTWLNESFNYTTKESTYKDRMMSHSLNTRELLYLALLEAAINIAAKVMNEKVLL